MSHVLHRGSLAFVAIATALLMATPALADGASPCELRIDGDPLPESWSGAVTDVRALVSKLTFDATDCRIIALVRDDTGLAVRFTTADGREARRHVTTPAELVPLVEALLVFRPDAEPLAAAPASEPTRAENDVPIAAATIVTIDPAVPLKDAKDAKDPPLASATARPLIGAAAGVKGSFPDDRVAAIAQILAGITLRRWELAAFARWEIEHDAAPKPEANAPPGKLRNSAFGGGVMLGRRQPVGPLVVIGGARAALFAAEQERAGQKKSQGQGAREDAFLDPRLGVYVGCILNESSRVRVRVQVDGDAGLMVHRSEVADLGAFPRWNLGVSLGAETALFQ